MNRFRWLDLHSAVAWEGIADTISGKSARLAKAAQDRQEQLLADERAKVDAADAGQRQAGMTGGGGLLAYVDDPKKMLRKTLG